MARIEALVGQERFAAGRYDLAGRLLDELISAAEFADFLTLAGYPYLA
jgi:malate synthase